MSKVRCIGVVYIGFFNRNYEESYVAGKGLEESIKEVIKGVCDDDGLEIESYTFDGSLAQVTFDNGDRAGFSETRPHLYVYGIGYIDLNAIPDLEKYLRVDSDLLL